MSQVQTLFELIRYGGVAITSHIFIFAGTAILVEFFGVDPSTAYISVITLGYIGLYLLSVYFVFRTKTSKKNLGRFIILLITSYIVNIVVFTLLHDIAGLPYPLVLILNIISLGPLRFLASKYFVYHESLEK